MPPSLDTIPFDIHFVIISYLSLEDVVRVGKACRQLGSILRESTLCRKTVETSANFSNEAKLARNGKLTWQDALQRIYLRKAAFSAGDPFSACVIGQGTQFIYEQGVLCTLLEGDKITIQNLHYHERPPISIMVMEMLKSKGYCMRYEHYAIELLHYSHAILSLGLHSEDSEEESEEEEEEEKLLVVLSFSKSGTITRPPLVRQLESRDKLFVRNDSNYLYYGTHSRLGTRGHHEWVIRGTGLKKTHTLPQDNYMQLEDFVGSEIGTTVTFQIHDGYFYALSNQTSFTVEEVDWTSLYTVFRFPLDKPDRKAVEVNTKIFRREHAEGPIHDLWTDLSLQVDERTNELIICESRREWLDGGSKQSRTFYTQHIWFPEKIIEEEEGEAAGSATGANSSETALYPAGDLFVNVIGSENNPHYIPSEPRQPHQVHEEFAKNEARSFILAKTKFRTYNMSCSTFLDLVEDTECCPLSPNGCLRLRIGARRDMSWENSERNYQTITLNPDASARDAARRLYSYSRINLWPPLAPSPQEADSRHQILNPRTDPTVSPSNYCSMHVSGISDERSLVYMIRPARARSESDHIGDIVLIAFDPFMRVEPHGEDSGKSGTLWRREQCSWQIESVENPRRAGTIV
ncbi:hypothetical protein NA57DRAFT_71700 [Rhizodiscina lignyota]|uniref:F-box domain-containing protein n=1 Tax=Rhizodiscina lignyota TaxID=1504668 RepID=A0A9P4MEL2_9PEZI|nr:hypothetical protein NA57DRAFT_71700 [Rhizodiscina lignyota]